MTDAIGRLRAEVELAEKTAHFLVRVDTADLRTLLTALDGDEAVTDEVIDAGVDAWVEAGGSFADSTDFVGPVYLAMRNAIRGASAPTIMVHGEPREIAEFDKPDTVEPIIDKQIWPDK